MTNQYAAPPRRATAAAPRLHGQKACRRALTLQYEKEPAAPSERPSLVKRRLARDLWKTLIVYLN